MPTGPVILGNPYKEWTLPLPTKGLSEEQQARLREQNTFQVPEWLQEIMIGADLTNFAIPLMIPGVAHGTRKLVDFFRPSTQYQSGNFSNFLPRNFHLASDPITPVEYASGSMRGGWLADLLDAPPILKGHKASPAMAGPNPSILKGRIAADTDTFLDLTVPKTNVKPLLRQYSPQYKDLINSISRGDELEKLRDLERLQDLDPEKFSRLVRTIKYPPRQTWTTSPAYAVEPSDFLLDEITNLKGKPNQSLIDLYRQGKIFQGLGRGELR